MAIKDRRAITLEKAYNIVERAARNIKVDDKQEKLLELLSVSCPVIELYGEKYIPFLEFKGFIDNFSKAMEQDNCSFLQRRRGYKTDRIVDVIEFAESAEFYGMGGSLYPQVSDALWEIFHGDRNIVEIVLTGASSTGKSFLLDCGFGYKIYLLSCMHDPQAEFDLAPGTTLLFPMQSKTERSAKNILFDPFRNRVNASPYFKDHFRPNPRVRSKLEFPNHITVQPFNGSDDAVLGMTVISGGITELNRMEYIRESKKAKGENIDYDQALQVYNTISRRQYSRTQQKGKVPGHLFLDGASENPDDFTSQKVKEAETNKNIYVYSYKQWEVGKQSRYSGEKFLVEVGTAERTTRIIQSKDEAEDPSRVEEIPMEYYGFFARDPEGSLRDFGGITISGARPGIPYREHIEQGFKDFEDMSGGKQFFKYDEIVFEKFFNRDDIRPDWTQILDLAYINECMLGGVALALHIDLGISKDACGMSIGHLSGFVKRPAIAMVIGKGDRREIRELEDVADPIVTIDGITLIRGLKGGQVDIDWVKSFVLWLPTICNLRVATMDAYQSTSSLQAFQRARLTTGVVSMDASPEPYDDLRRAYQHKRIITPRHPTYRREILDLQFQDGKYDHLPHGSKDCADAVAGVNYDVESLLQYDRDARGQRARRPTQRVQNRRRSKARAIIRGGIDST